MYNMMQLQHKTWNLILLVVIDDEPHKHTTELSLKCFEL